MIHRQIAGRVGMRQHVGSGHQQGRRGEQQQQSEDSEGQEEATHSSQSDRLTMVLFAAHETMTGERYASIIIDRLSDSFDLQRFVEAQDPVYRRVVEELLRGRKRSHWMWFVFPQIAGLSFSAMAKRFAIGSRAEAVAYLGHDVLGPHLIECTRLVMAASEKTITEILGSPDDMKFRSCMTLFDEVSHQEIFSEAIGPSVRTGRILRRWQFSGAQGQAQPNEMNRNPAKPRSFFN
jgi:uncharacterized protein (DUF1810 family)